MFRKLVSNLAFSPGVSTQLAFYARRLRGEALTRKLSMVFGLGVMAFQLLAVVSPATSVNAAGGNNIIEKGFTEKGHLIQILKDNPETKRLFDQLGITTERLYVASAPKYIPARNSTKRSIGNHRQNTSDQAYVVGSRTYFTRPLSSVATTTNGRAIEGTTTSGAYFAVLLSCGNPVMDSFPTPTPPPPSTPQKPELHITKTTLASTPAANSTVKPGALLGYRVFFSNLGNGAGNYVTLTDAIPAGTGYIYHGSGGAASHKYESSAKSPYLGQPASKHVWWEYPTMPAKAENYYIDLKVTVLANVVDGTKICNRAVIRAINAPPKPSNEICHTVRRDAPTVTPTPDTPPPAIVIPDIPTTPITPPPTTPPTTPTPTTPPPITPTSPDIHMGKTAAYLSRSSADGTPLNANNTTAKAGDTIEYTLKTLNSGTGAKTGFVLSEPVADVLEYADIVSAGGGTLTNGSLVWPAIDIPAGTTITRVFQVKVKSPVPATPRSSADIYSYDLRMDNVYGDEVKIAVETPTPAKQMELAAQTLPETGAETNILIVFFVAAMGVYFYSRNKQLVHEVAILRVDHNPGV